MKQEKDKDLQLYLDMCKQLSKYSYMRERQLLLSGIQHSNIGTEINNLRKTMKSLKLRLAKRLGINNIDNFMDTILS